MFQFHSPQFTVAVETSAQPFLHDSYVKSAKLVEEFADSAEDDRLLYVTVTPRGEEWPTLVVKHGYSRIDFQSGALLVPETGILFLAAGDRLLAYQASVPKRLWEDTADCGFWRWERHEDVVLMHVEIELAAWSTGGKKLWSKFADPPWSCTVRNQSITLIDCRETRELSLHSGEPLPNSA